MKALKCELCGSNDVVKQDGLFVCQHCGTKYTVEEAKKLMIEGTVRIDDSLEIKNLYEIARRAKNSNNNEDAAKYYELVMAKDPSSLEAVFYSVYCKSMTCKIAEIETATLKLQNVQTPVLELISKMKDSIEQKKSVMEITNRYSIVADTFSKAATQSFYDIDYTVRDRFEQGYIKRLRMISAMLYVWGEGLINFFGDLYGFEACEVWKQAIAIHASYIPRVVEKKANKDFIMEYVDKIRRYEEDYFPPIIDTDSNSDTSGCYVATAVYGSYNCPEVWTLRRFRDNTLDETWYGRAFIKTYYAISPTLVKWFGNTEWFKKMCRVPLDKMVSTLQENGVESTPYQDKY